MVNCSFSGNYYVNKELIQDEKILKIAKLKKLRLAMGFPSHEQLPWEYNINRVQLDDREREQYNAKFPS